MPHLRLLWLIVALSTATLSACAHRPAWIDAPDDDLDDDARVERDADARATAPPAQRTPAPRPAATPAPAPAPRPLTTTERRQQQAQALREQRALARAEAARKRQQQREEAARKRQQRLDAQRRAREQALRKRDAPKPSRATAARPAPAPAQASPPAPRTPARAAAANTSLPAVFDLCALAPSAKASDTYVKQRLVMLSPGGLDKVEGPEPVTDGKGNRIGTQHTLKAVGGAAHLRDVWTQTFPLKRFYNVVSSTPTPSAWRDLDTLTLAAFSAALTSDASAFVARSAACADFLALPYLSAFEASWTKTTREVTELRNGKQVKVKKTVWSLTIKPTLELHVFRREGRAFTRLDTLTLSGGGLFDAVADLGNLTQLLASPGNPAAAQQARQLADRYRLQLNATRDAIAQLLPLLTSIDSDDPDDARRQRDALQAQLDDLYAQRDTLLTLLEDPAGAADALATAQNGGWDGLVSGLPPNTNRTKATYSTRGGEATNAPLPARAPFWLKTRTVGVAGMSERNRPECKDLSGDALEAIARCTLRARAENLSLLTQEAARGLDGWRLYAPLRAVAWSDSLDDLPDPSSDDPDDPDTLDTPDARPSPDASAGPATLAYGFALGDHEGVRRGDVFWAMCPDLDADDAASSDLDDEDDDDAPASAASAQPPAASSKLTSCGFARVTHPGPGGPLGAASPSLLTFRSGDARPGVRMEEHPQLGVHFTPQFTSTFALDTRRFAYGDADPNGLNRVDGPNVLNGFELATAFALTPYVDYRSGELLLRTELGAGFGRSRLRALNAAFDWAVLHALAGPEIALYAAPRVNLFFALLGGVTAASVSTRARTVTVDGKDEPDSGAGLSYGTLKATGGLDLILHPDWRLRASVGYARNLTPIRLSPPDVDDSTPSGFSNQDAGTLSGAKAQVGLGYIF